MKAKLTMYNHIGKLCEPNNGYTKEFNLVSWNNREPVYDIRTWNTEHTEWKEGITITYNEMCKFRKLSNDYFSAENTDEKLRSIYISFVSKLKNGSFDENLYNTLFEQLQKRFRRWKLESAIPVRLFQVCIDLLYVLSKDNPLLLREYLEKIKTAKDEMYGLFMDLD